MKDKRCEGCLRGLPKDRDGTHYVVDKSGSKIYIGCTTFLGGELHPDWLRPYLDTVAVTDSRLIAREIEENLRSRGIDSKVSVSMRIRVEYTPEMEIPKARVIKKR